MDFKDLREFITRVEALGELKVIENADWNLELGAIGELISYRRDGPAVLFDNIKGYPKGFRVISNLFGTLSRTALLLRLPTDLREMQLVQAWKERLRALTSSKPVKVRSGPVLENVIKEEQVDLLKFPVPRWHEDDGGRYIGTGDVVLTKDPDEGWVNLGTYRVMVQNRNTLGIWISPGHHGRLMMQKYWSQGKSAPIAVSVGQDPTYLASSVLSSPWGVSEYETVSQISGRPMEVVDAPFTGIPVPANAEIIIEGECPPPEKESMPEGPFGEWTGYYATGARNETIVKVKSILHRDDPIITGAPEMRPFAPGHGLGYLPTVVRCGYLWNQLEHAGVQGITGVWWLLPGYRYLQVISLKQMYAGHSKRAAFAAMGTADTAYHGRFVILVDDDIDPSNIDEVMWAVCTRCDPETAIDLARRCWSTPLDPLIPPEKRERKDFTASRMVIDACRPYYWKDKFPKVNAISESLKEETLKKWGGVIGYQE